MTYYREKYKLCTFIEISEKHRTTAERHEGTEPGCHYDSQTKYDSVILCLLITMFCVCDLSE